MSSRRKERKLYLNETKIEQSINNARKRWEQCLKETDGNIKKARELYDKI
jgi:hypothetical protein